MATTYPFAVDNSTSLPPAPSTVDGYTYINANTGAVEAIETELGVLPSSSYPSVRVRLDVLESRINNPCVPTGGDYISIGGTDVTIIAGYGDPNVTAVSAFPGSLYLRQDGYNDQTLYSMNTDGYWFQVGAATGGSKTGITNITSSNSPYNVVSTDNIIAANSTGGPITINLPSSPNEGDVYQVKDSNGTAVTNNITVNGSGHNLDGSPNYVMSVDYESLDLVFNGSQWSVL
jgi:hypothetical protein